MQYALCVIMIRDISSVLPCSRFKYVFVAEAVMNVLQGETATFLQKIYHTILVITDY